MESSGSGAGFQGPFFPLKPLLHYLNSTPEQVSFVERYLSRTTKARPERHEGSFLTEQPRPGEYSLERNDVCWVLNKGGTVYLRRELGVDYFAWMLGHPWEYVAIAELVSRFSKRGREQLPVGELPEPESAELDALSEEGLAVEQWSPEQDEEEFRKTNYAKLREYKQMAEDAALPEAQRREARRLHDELEAFLEEQYRPAPHPGRAVAKLFNRNIQRCLKHLQEPGPGAGAPNPVAVGLAEYLERYILVPSRRYTQAKPGACVRLARGELAGRLIFECPPGDHWSVRF